jgi:uncharacterized protein
VSRTPGLSSNLWDETTIGKRTGRRAIVLALLALAVMTLVYLGVGLFVAMQLTAPPDRQPVEQTPADVGLDYREVSFQSADGLDLAGWWAPGDDPSRAAVLVHGLGGSKSDRHVVETARIYAGAGYGVLMIDLRGQGYSEGERITMGYQEVRDVRGALSWLKERGFGPNEVVLHGFSMGAATVVRAAPGAGVAAVVEEAGYADLPLLLQDALPEASGLPPFFTPGVLLMAKLFLGFDPWAVRPEEEAKTLSEQDVPLLIIHSTDDRVVPFGHAESFKVAYPAAALWQIEGHEHVGAHAHPEYRRTLLGFLEGKTSDNGTHKERSRG